MRNKKMFLSVILVTTIMLFAGGCGNLVKPVSAEPTETGKEADTEESLEPTTSPAAEPEESMEGAEADTTEEGDGQDSEYEIIALEDTVMYAAADCDIMSDAGAQCDTVGSLSYAQEVTVNGKVETGEDELWYVIKTEDGSTQMVSASLLSETKPAAQTASGSGSGSGSNSGGSTGGTGNSQSASTTPAPQPETTPAPTPEPTVEPTQPPHVHEWKEHMAETHVWIPNVVTVEDYETQKVIVSSVYRCNCGFETSDKETREEHAYQHCLNGEYANYQAIYQYEDQQVLVGTHTEDQGHWETSTYVDYYYCECGARK